jgi:predicted amidohydrolase YtcJ
MIIDSHEKVIAELGLPDTNRGTVVIHAQFIRQDQLSKFKQHHIFPSFFTNHCYYWGDVHMVNMGKERTFFLSPLKAALDSGIIFTNHTDFNVTPLNALFTVWTAVNRVSRSGVVIGPDQRISPYEALKSITFNSAREIGEEKTKGSIEPGKFADLVILSDDPLKIDPSMIRDIKVLTTIKEGKIVFSRH